MSHFIFQSVIELVSVCISLAAANKAAHNARSTSARKANTLGRRVAAARKTNRTHRNRGVRLVAKSDAQRVAARSARIAKAERKWTNKVGNLNLHFQGGALTTPTAAAKPTFSARVLGVSRKYVAPVVKRAVAKITRTVAQVVVGLESAVARPSRWHNHQEPVAVFGRHKGIYASPESQEPGYWEEQETVLLNAQALAAIEQGKVDEEEETTLLNFAAPTEKVEVEETTLLVGSPDQKLLVVPPALRPTAASVVDPGLVVPVELPPTETNKPIGVKNVFNNVAAFEAHAQSVGAIGMLQEFMVAASAVQRHYLAHPIMQMILMVRGQGGQALGLPTVIAQMIKEGRSGLVPECVRPYLPGAEMLNHLLAKGRAANWLVVEANEKRQGFTSTGIQYFPVGHKADMLADYNDVLKALSRHDRAPANTAPNMVGYQQREAKFFTNIVRKCMLLAHEDMVVVVTPQIFAAIKLYISDPANKALVIKAKFVAVPANWHMPVEQVSYETIEAAFRRLQVEIKNNYSKVEGLAPIFYNPVINGVNGAGFKLTLGGGSVIYVHKSTDGRPELVYHKAAGNRAEYVFRSAVVTVPGLQGEIPADHCVKLNPLAQLWYAMESYCLASLNRPHNAGKQVFATAGEGVFLSRFLQNCMPMQFEEGQVVDKIYTNRSRFEQNKFDLCVVAMPFPFLVERIADDKLLVQANGHYHHYLTTDGEEGKGGVTAYYNQLSASASMVANKAPALAMVKAINKHGLSLIPTGDTSQAMSADLLRISFAAAGVDKAAVLATKQEFVALLQNLWADLEPTFGKFDPTNELQLIEIIWSKPAIAAEMKAKGITQHGALATQYFEFWQVLQEQFEITLSGKESKVEKRVIMTYSVACPSEQNVPLGFRSSHANINYGIAVKATVTPNLKQAPGSGLAQIDAIIASYSTKDQVSAVVVPHGAKIWVELTPELKALATDIYVNVADSQALAGYTFPVANKAAKVKGHLVKQGDPLGTTMLQLSDTAEPVAMQQFFAQTTGNIYELLIDRSRGFGGTETFYAYAKITELVINSQKLRSPVALKLNVLPVKIWHYLNPNSGCDLNGADTKNIELVVYGDSYKGSDNLTSMAILAGVNLSHYAATHPELRQVLVDTNYAIQAFRKEELFENDEYLFIDYKAIALGIYKPALEKFQELFETSIWHYDRTPVSDRAYVHAMNTRNRALAARESSVTPNSNLQGTPWRLIGSKEAATIVGKNGAPLPANVLAEVASLEAAGTYYDPELAVGTAYIATNAVGAITETDYVACLWSEYQETANPDGSNNKISVAHYCMLDRSYGWGPKNGLDLIYPVEVEAIPVLTAMSKTSVMPFSLVQFAIEQRSDLALDHLVKVRENTHFDGTLSSMINGYHLQTDSGNELINLNGWSGDAAHEVLSPELLALLQQPEIFADDQLFLKTLAANVGDAVFKLPRTKGNPWTVHLATLYNWNKGSIRRSGESVLKAVCAWFKAWVSGKRAQDEQMKDISRSAWNMLNKYYIGKGHMKSLLRGKATVFIKAQACNLVPSSELWINASDAAHFASVFGVRDLSEITAVGFRRMPMFATNISRLRVLSKTDINYYRKEYGVLFSRGLAYMGTVQMYSNFGDLDGDAIEIGDMSTEFNAGLCKHDDFNTIRTMLHEVLGVDSLHYTYWMAPHADQYIADHFMIDTWAKFKTKCRPTWKANCTTANQRIEKQLAAGTVQTVTVGLTYRVATLLEMLAEILPVVWDDIKANNSGVTPQWLSAFEWTCNPDTARITIARLIQLYEVALGGYDTDMSKVTLGYLIRIMGAQHEVGEGLPQDLLLGMSSEQGSTSNLNHLFPAAGAKANFRPARHLNLNVVSTAFENLGFQPADLSVFADCFAVAGLCTEYTRKEALAASVPHDLRIIFDMIQTVLDISQVKLNEGSGVLGYTSYCNTIAEYKTKLAEGELGYQNYLDLSEKIRTTTVSGMLFDAFELNNILVVNAKDSATFAVGTLAQIG